MVKLILVDVDGTLVGSDGVPESAWQALEDMRAVGVRLAVCTGRPSLGRQRGYARRLEPDGVHIFDAGGVLARADGSVVTAARIPPAALRAAAAIAESCGHVLELYPADGRYLVLGGSAGVDAHAALLDSPATVVQLEDVAQETIVRAQFLVAPGTTFDAARPAAQAIPGCHVHEATSPVMPGYRFCALTRADASKVQAAKWLAEELGITLDHVAAVGDGDNDAGLLAAVGFGVAMGNASAATRQAADAVAAHVDADGLADAMRLIHHRGLPGAWPPWRVGDTLTLRWLARNATAPPSPRPDVRAEVIQAEPEHVVVQAPEGPLAIARANGHPLEAARAAPRWVAVKNQTK